ncbi:MAG: response regulator transcription factor [Planctomycetota bacterium]|nr:response regulator transcription factor [Planctomycetota bacterium]
MTLKILLADDHNLIREGLRLLIEKQPGMTVVGEAADGRTAVRLGRELTPNIAIIDILMPELNGIDATRRILEASPKTRVIVLSMQSDKRFVAAALKAGAAGYLLKDGVSAEVSDAIRAVAAGQTYLSPRIAGVVVEDYVSNLPAGAAKAGSALSAREREVLQLIADGKTTKQVAATLHTSISTVETHRRHIMEKLHLFSVAELTKYAIREGLTSPDK